MSAIVLGGVIANVLTPPFIPAAHKNQVIFHIHGGGNIFGPGAAGTGESRLMAAMAGTEFFRSTTVCLLMLRILRR